MIIDHGEWAVYEPEINPFKNVQHRIMFCRRVSDGRDWYEFRKELENDNIKLTVDLHQSTVQTTSRDVSALFPAGARLLEMDAAPDFDHAALRRRILRRQEIPAGARVQHHPHRIPDRAA